MYEIKVTSKGQVTIPKEIREKMGLQSGDYLEVKESAAGGYLIKKKVDKKKIEKYVGILNEKESSDEIVRELRGHDSSN